jgi:hypothetical protein
VSPNLAIGIVRLPLRRHDRLQRSLVRTHPAAAVMSAWVRKPVRLAAPAIGYHERHVFIEASTVDRLPPKSVLEHPHQNPNTTTGPELTVRYGGPNSHLSRPTARASNHRFDAAALAAGEDPGAWRPTRGVTIDGPQINCPIPQPGQNISSQGVPAIGGARIVGDRNMSRLATSSFQRSMTAFASARAAASVTCRY